MLNLKNRTEFSFRWAYGQIEKVLDTNQGSAAGMCDRHGTWGHVQWRKACKKKGIKPIYGVELAVVYDMDEREKQPTNYMSFLAKNNEGYEEINELVSLATEKKYYFPRIDYNVVNGISENVVVLSGSEPCWERLAVDRKSFYVELNPMCDQDFPEIAKAMGLKCVATSDNFYPRLEHKNVYEVVADSFNVQKRPQPMHILNVWEWEIDWQDQEEAVANTYKIADMCSNVELLQAELVHPEVTQTLLEMCEEAAPKRKIDLSDPVYKERLDMELGLIAEKKYEDYFFLVADLVKYAKKHMLVGPARGSSCGSIVCYLLDITDIDPIPYDLLFERFIDLNRMDLPDIDIDFPDDKRYMVAEYLKEKYGSECVAQLGTVSRFKAKSTIQDVSKALKIPAWEVQDLKDAIIERSGGDSRAAFCILDTFNQLDIGKATLKKFPELEMCSEVEAHARHTGVHAAGILVTKEPISKYCPIDFNTGAAQIDKYDAEELNLLKIDVLGLRTLSVIQDTLDQIGKEREWLTNYPTDDKAAFAVLNNNSFSGIFQFEGYALQSLCQQLDIEHFEDMVSITALGRPGPLNSGGATEFLKRRTGQNAVSYMHPMAEKSTKVTYGVVVYQEQVMQLAREMGNLSWADVSSLRKAMSKSLGKEFFDSFWVRFKAGAAEQGVSEEDAKTVWDNINTMGSWAFNRSHAVAYGMMSYWCCVLKAHHPVEYAAACLRNAKDTDQSIKILRELVNEGYEYLPYHRDHSALNWTVQDGKLIGGLMGIKGVGPKLAENILHRRETGQKLTPRLEKLLTEGTTPYDMVFECDDRWGHIIEDPSICNIQSDLRSLESITSKDNGSVVFIAKLTEKNLRDHNELQNLEKRGGRRMTGQTMFLNITLEDDTGSIIATIDRFKYLKYGKPIIENGKNGDWYIWKGKIRRGFRKIYLDRWKKLTGEVKEKQQLAEKD